MNAKVPNALDVINVKHIAQDVERYLGNSPSDDDLKCIMRFLDEVGESKLDCPNTRQGNRIYVSTCNHDLLLVTDGQGNGALAGIRPNGADWIFSTDVPRRYRP